MKNRKKFRNKFRAPSETVKKTEESRLAQKMPVPTEKEEAEVLIESTKTQVQNEPNNNVPNSVAEETKIIMTVTEEPSENEVTQDQSLVCAQDANPIPVILEDEAIKHPLEHMWALWLYMNETKKNWADNMLKLTNFDTVEDFWCLYHHTKLPSELCNGQDYAIFKKGISPMWEDPVNKPGGRWFINMEQRTREMDRIWLDVVLLMIGESFADSNIICGAVVNVRTKKPNKISIWTRSKDETAVMSIGRQLKQALQLHFRLQFLDHKNNTLFIV